MMISVDVSAFELPLVEHAYKNGLSFFLSNCAHWNRFKFCFFSRKIVFSDGAFVDDGISILEHPTTLKYEIEKEVFMVLYEMVKIDKWTYF